MSLDDSLNRLKEVNDEDVRVREFVEGYIQLVRRTGITCVSNDYDSDCYVVPVSEPDKLIGYIGIKEGNTEPTFELD